MSTPRSLAAALPVLLVLLALVVPAAAAAQAPTVEQTTAVYVGTYQQQCRSIVRGRDRVERDIARAGRGARTRLQRYRIQARLLARYYENTLTSVRNLAAAVPPPEYAAFQSRFRAEYKRDKARLRRQIRAIRRAKTAAGIVRTIDRFNDGSQTVPLPAALKEAAPACDALD